MSLVLPPTNFLKRCSNVWALSRSESTFLWNSQFEWIVIKFIWKCIASICFGPNHSGKKMLGQNLDFWKSYFLFLRWNWVFKTSALWADAFYKLKCPSVCPCVCPSICVFTFEVPFKRLFAPTYRSRLSNIRNPWGKVMERSGLRLEHFCLNFFKNGRAKKSFFLPISSYKIWWKPRFPMD